MKKVIKLKESELQNIILKVLNEQENDRYMFFSNLEQMRRQCDLLLELNHDEIESILDDGHDWAQDHIAEAKNNLDQVFDFLMNTTKRYHTMSDEVVSESKLDFIIGKPISLIRRLHTTKYNPETGNLEKVKKDEEIQGKITNIKSDDSFSVPTLTVKYPNGIAQIMYEKSKDRFVEGNSTFLYEYIPLSPKDERTLNLFKVNFYEENDKDLMEEGRKKTGTKLCARGKAAAKARYKIYPSAYSNGHAIRVCKGDIKGLDGKKQCSSPYC